jgi:hypothetical protein
MNLNVETLARELHDVAFAWNHFLQPWDGMTGEQRQWFLDRAGRIVGEGGDDELGGEGPPFRDTSRVRLRSVRRGPPGRLAAEAVHKAVKEAMDARNETPDPAPTHSLVRRIADCFGLHEPIRHSHQIFKG